MLHQVKKKLTLTDNHVTNKVKNMLMNIVK